LHFVAAPSIKSFLMKALVTGATGFIGSYLVRELLIQGHQVTALCQPGSSAQYGFPPDVKLALGDVTEPESLRKGCEPQDCIFHCAGIVSGYGSWERFFKVGVEGTRNMINVASNVGVRRFVHLSSISVYGTRPRGQRYTELTPLKENPERWNHYVRQKVLSEKVVWKAYNEGHIQVIAIRPSLVLGPGDRNVVRRTLSLLQSPLGAIIGSGTNRVPCVVVNELVKTIIIAAANDHAVGKAYNLSGCESITQREYMDLHAAAAGVKPLKRKMPVSVAQLSCSILERMYRIARREDEPFCTRLALAFATNDFDIDCSLAMRDLGWRGGASYEEAIRGSVKWYLSSFSRVE